MAGEGGGAPGAGERTAAVSQLWERAQLDELLEGMSATAFLLRFTLTNPDMHTILVGTLNPMHLHENIAAVLQGPLPASVYHEAQRRLAAAWSGG